MTNADKIRNMTNYQLEAFLKSVTFNSDCPNRCLVYKDGCHFKCTQTWLDWLKEEVEDEE